MKKWKIFGSIGFGLLLFSLVLLANDFQEIFEDSNIAEALLVYAVVSGLFIVVISTVVSIHKKNTPSH